LGTNVCFAGLGTAAGEYCQKHKTLAVQRLQYVFATKVRADFGLLAGGMGVNEVLVQMFGL
jgi:hypothetical protein